MRLKPIFFSRRSVVFSLPPLLLLVFFIGLFSNNCLWAEDRQHHVILISIDGLQPDFYLDPDKYHLDIPNLLSLMEKGSFAQKMVGVYPTLTYPSHTSMITGVRPARHGIVSNFILAPIQSLYNWYLNASDIKAKAVWEAAKDKGLKTAIVTWPVSYGADVDYLIPENLSLYPKGDVSALIRQGSTAGLFDDLEKKFGPIKLLPFPEPDACIPLDKMTTDFAAEIIRRHKPNLFLMHLLDLDHQQHATGIDTPEVFHSLEHIDGLIGKIIRASQQAGILDQTTFIIVGDHGFIPVHTSIDFNILLLGEGLLTVNKTGSIASWSVFVQGNGGSAAVYVKDRKDKQLIAKAKKTLQAEIESRYVGIVKIIRRDQLDRMGSFPTAIFALEALDGYFFDLSNPKSQMVNKSNRYKGMHGYLPSNPKMASGFIASGRGIRKGVLIPSMRMIDIAPTIAKLLGIELSSAEGLPLVGILNTP